MALAGPADLTGWRDAARALVMAGIPPEAVAWESPADPPPLFGGPPPPAPPPEAPRPLVPRGFLDLAALVIRHRDPARFALLHRLLARLQAERSLLEVATDPDVARAEAMARAVRRDAHKMHAFVRFRAVPGGVADAAGVGGVAPGCAVGAAPEDAAPRYVAWFEPTHHILEAEAGFFARRFAQLRWSILTPEASAHWDGARLLFGPGARRADAPPEDAAEDLWRAYFAAIFNPARLKPDAMRAEMPVRYWRNLPEVRDIPRLIAEAPGRVAAMVERGATPPAPRRQRAAATLRSAATPAPLHRNHASGVVAVAMPEPASEPAPPGDAVAALDALKRELFDRPDLPPWAAHATQGVFGEGRPGAMLLFVGEQPGDEEDLQGRPFVGPAGRLFDRALGDAGIPRAEAYVTNAVKHFKFTATGRRRLHQSPDASDIAYYQPFLRREIALVGPRLVVSLGASALRAITGRAMPVTKLRGSLLRGPDGRPFFPTVHPSYLLRLPDEAAKRHEYDRLVEDLGKAAATARALPAAG